MRCGPLGEHGDDVQMPLGQSAGVSVGESFRGVGGAGELPSSLSEIQQAMLGWRDPILPKSHHELK